MPQSNNNYFRELDLEELKRTANLWVKDKDKGGSCIQRVFLYRSVKEGKNNGFVFVVEISTNDEAIFSDYQNWVWGSCLHIQDILPSFYTELKPPVPDKWIWITFRDDVDTVVNIAQFKNHCDPDCKVVLYPNPVDCFCKEAIKKEYTSITHLSFILAEDEQYTDQSLACLWENLEMKLRDRKAPDFSSTEKKAGTWFKILQRVISGKITGISHPLTIKRLTNYDENQMSGELHKPIYGGNGDFIKLSDLKTYFKDQLEMEPPLKLFSPQQEGLTTKGKANSNHTRQVEFLKEQLFELLKQYCPELEHFYNGWVQDLTILGLKRDSATTTKLKDTAVDYFLRDSETYTYNFLQKENVCDDSFYEYTSKGKRTTIGRILQQIVKEELEPIWYNTKIETTIKALASLHNKLK